MERHIDLLADAIRWWGFLAGVLGLDDFRRRWITWQAFREHAAIRLPWADAWAKAGMCGFLVLAGFGIPLARRVGLDLQGVPFSAYMTLAWLCVSAAGWSYVVSRAERATIMFGVAAGAFIVTMLAAWATASG